jgi:hypothetical protein
MFCFNAKIWIIFESDTLERVNVFEALTNIGTAKSVGGAKFGQILRELFDDRVRREFVKYAVSLDIKVISGRRILIRF